MINRGFAETMALKRSAGLETVACWQIGQPVDRPRRPRPARRAVRPPRVLRDRLDRRRAPRGGPDDGRLHRPGPRRTTATCPVLARPDARLHLPKHHAICSWVTAQGRQPPFIAATIPLCDRWRAHRPPPRAPGASAADAGSSPSTRRTGIATRTSSRRDMTASRSEAADQTPGRTPGRRRRPRAGTSPTRPASASATTSPSCARSLRAEIARTRQRRAATPPRRPRPRRRPRDRRGAPDRPDPAAPRRAAAPPASASAKRRHRARPGRPAPESYTELVAVDEATRVSWPRRMERRALDARRRSTSRSSPGWPTCASRSRPRSTAGSSPRAPTRRPSAGCGG